MKKLLTILAIASSFMLIAENAHAGRQPCSGKKGGVSHCTAGGKYVCNDGSISKSKKVCTIPKK